MKRTGFKSARNMVMSKRQNWGRWTVALLGAVKELYVHNNAMF